MIERRFFNPYAEIRFTKNRLPHRQQDGITYFVTFRLVDAIPTNLLDQWRSERDGWLKFHPKPWDTKTETHYQKLFTAKLEHWLDSGHGSCTLREPRLRSILDVELRKSDSLNYQHHSWVIMPNHVHALFTLASGQSLATTLHQWKGSSANAMNKHSGKHGRLWMKDYFDRMVRDAEHFWRCARYIRRNPKKARLANKSFTLFESEYVRDVLDGKTCG